MRGSFLFHNDLRGHYPAQSYYTATTPLLSPFPPLAGECHADIGIVGAGYTGLSAALHLAQAGFKVVVLEAHRVGWGASGRNGGQLGSGLNKNQWQLEKQFGLTHARALWDLSIEAIELCQALIQQHQIECDLQAGIIYACHRKRYLAELHAYAEKMQRDYNYDKLEPLSRADLHTKLKSPTYYGGLLNHGAAHLHPLKYALGLAQAAQQAGVQFYENSPVLSYSANQPVVVKTERGELNCKFLVLACNGYLDQLEPSIAARVMPINNYIVATESLSSAQIQALIPERQAVADTRFVVNYFRISADQRLLFGGGESYSFRFPTDIRALVRPRLLQVFPQLNKVNLDYAWGGTLAITMSRLPNFSRLRPNIFSVSGYSGHGIALATLAGKLIAESIQGQDSRFSIFEALPKPLFPGGTWLRWPLLVTAMLYYSLRDRL
ncbi:NAD(P)/FAD-dependent oxidoreductase [Thiolinea disciformis]|uniref:NAD(P)/FAD-dependent oxidoreductase n=1 Tax=Thiolinea disciformis TaxID=125614 RepID=UPI00036C02E6|nr:FAD-binding oxidoreductase [Thiolinea disciformis]